VAVTVVLDEHYPARTWNRVVLAPRCWRQVFGRWWSPKATVAKQPDTGESAT